jgi:hypothetical protein
MSHVPPYSIFSINLTFLAELCGLVVWESRTRATEKGCLVFSAKTFPKCCHFQPELDSELVHINMSLMGG